MKTIGKVEDSTYSVRRVVSQQEFAMLERVWDSLCVEAHIENIFLTHEWLCEWWGVYGVDEDGWVLVAEREGTIDGVAPFALVRDPDGTRRVICMGQGELTPNHLDLAVRPSVRSEVVRAFCNYLWQHRSEWDVLDLNKLAGESPTRSLLLEEFRTLGLPALAHVTARCPYAADLASFEAYLEALGRKTRHGLRGDLRSLERDFPQARFLRVETPEDLERAFDALVRLHQARWQKRGEPGSFASERFVRFHRRMAHVGLERGWLWMLYLQADDEIGAVRYGYRLGTRMFFYLTTFDERWSKYGIGMLMRYVTAQVALPEGVRELDFLEGEEDHKKRWATGVRDNWCVRVSSTHLRGRWIWLRRFYFPRLRHTTKERGLQFIRRPAAQSIETR